MNKPVTAQMSGKTSDAPIMAMQVVRGGTPLYETLEKTNDRPDTRLLYGETVDLLLPSAGSWLYVRNHYDGYEGYVRREALSPDITQATHRVCAIETGVLREPRVQASDVMRLEMNSLVCVTEKDDKYVKIENLGWVNRSKVAPTINLERDFVEVMSRHVGREYDWGGGTDCSGLLQRAIRACGQKCPRNTSDQARMLGRTVVLPERRGDVVFSGEGHVAVVIKRHRSALFAVHATGDTHEVVVQPLEWIIDRLKNEESKAPVCTRRLPDYRPLFVDTSAD